MSARLRRDVVDDGDARARPDRGHDDVDEPGGIEARVRHGHRAHDGPPLTRDEGGDARRRAVVVIGQEQLIARLERERSQDRVDARRRVVHEHEVRSARADERRHGVSGGPHPRRLAARQSDQARDLAQQEMRRLPLHLVANLLLDGEDAPGHGPDGAVIQVRHIRVKRPVRVHLVAERHVLPPRREVIVLNCCEVWQGQ